ALQIEKFGPEEANRFGAGGHRCLDARQGLDVGTEMYRHAVARDGRQIARGLHLPPALARRPHPLAVGPQGRLVGIDDDFAAAPVDDDGRARTDLGRDLADAHHVREAEGARDDRRMRGRAPALADDRLDARALQMKEIQRTDVDAERHRAVRRVRLRAQLWQADEHAEQAIRRRLEIALPVAEIGIVEPRELGADSLERPRHRPFRRQALLADEPPGLARQLRAAKDQAVEIDDLQAGRARPADELPPQPIELVLRGLRGGLQPAELGVAIVPQDPPLRDGHPDLHQVRRTERDALRGAPTPTTYHRLRA